MAIDRQAIVDLALHHHGRPATGYLWPPHWAADPAAPSFDYRPVEAFHLLFPSSHGSGPTRPSRVAQGERLQFSCLVPERVAPHDRIAIVLQKQLFDIGVDMAIEPVPVAELIGRLASGEYDAALLDLSSGASLAPLYPYWHSSGPSFGDLGYDAADAALDALQAATTDDQIRSAVSALQQVFYDDPPAIFLCWPETTRALSRRFVIPDPELDLGSSVARWYPATGVDQGS
jgi:ABC-type transport system substrate-binding protein